METSTRFRFSSEMYVEASKPSQHVENSFLKMLYIDDVPTTFKKRADMPSVESLTSMLQKCRKKKSLQHAKNMYVFICDNGLEGHQALENFLVPMFVDCGCMLNAQQVFEKLLNRNEYSWSSLIQGYVECGKFQHALHLYQKMQEDSVSPNKFIFIAALKACVRLMGMKLGQELHAEISKEGYERDLFVGSTLVDLYAKCGSLAEAQDILHELPIRDVVLWTTLIAGYTEQGLGEEALKCLEKMQLDGVSPDAFAFVCGLKACGSIGALGKGRELHAEIADRGFKGDPFVASTLVDMYAKCGSLVQAREVFDEMQVRDVVSWTTLIGGYAEQGLGEEALTCFEQMQIDGVLPDAITLVCSLKACGSVGAVEKGREIHDQVNKRGCEGDAFVGNILIDMYAKCGLLSEAHHMFEKMAERDVITWNTLIAGYAEQGLGEEALSCLEWMRAESTCPNAVTFLYSVKACASIGDRDRGQYIHSEIVKHGFENDPFLGNTLVIMSAKCGLLPEARKVFDGLLVRNVVSWNALIVGYTELGLADEALKCLEQMQLEGVSPDAVTYVCSLKACGSIGAIAKGREIHADIARKENQIDLSSGNTLMVIYGKSCSQTGVILATSLIHMYARCGSMVDAELVFNAMPKRDLVIWNALITAYALQGKSEHVFPLFEKMMDEGCTPNDVTFLAVLTACSHAGLLDKGEEYFECMTKKYGITPTIKHHNCMVDLLSRSGQLDEAVAIMEDMPVQPDLVLWSTMLGACRKWGNIEIGRQAFEGVVRLDENHPAAFVSMSNIYVDG